MNNLDFAAVADDDTGATDLAGMLAERGLRTIQIIGIPGNGHFHQWTAGADAVVVAAGTRAATPRQAYDGTQAALGLLAASNPRVYAIKYCSTFDSTAEGNIGPSIDAALDHLGEAFTVALPALPVNGRTTYLGYHFVNGRLLSDSPMRHHPLTPMTNPDLVSHLQAQTRRRVGLLAYPHLRGGAEAARARLGQLRDEGVAIAILDCLDEADLPILGEATGQLKLLTGSSAWGRLVPRRSPVQVETKPPSRPALIVAGSCSVATLGQNEWWRRKQLPLFTLDARDLLRSGGNAEISSAIATCIGQGSPALLRTASTRDDIDAVQAWAAEQGKSPAAVGLEIAHALAAFTRSLVELAQPGALVVAGGETSTAICRALGFGALRIGPNIEPGVPLCHSLGRLELPVVLKSGNFGSPGFYGKAIAAMQPGASGA
jgi:uncharacterized protein YgbK (DUF1537 family)